MCQECISRNRVELLTENTPYSPAPFHTPTTENTPYSPAPIQTPTTEKDNEVYSSTQGTSLSQPATSTSSSSTTSSSTYSATSWVLLTSLRLRLTVFSLTFLVSG